MHTRIATHGPVIPENTHPFTSKTLGFAHNGMFNLEPLPQKTDSESFFLWTIADKTFEWCEENKFLLDMATDGCRCAIMDLKTGRIMHLCEADWKTNKAYTGYKFSNESYKERALSRWGSAYSNYTGNYTGNYGGSLANYNKYTDDFDDFSDWDEYEKYNEIKNAKKDEEPKYNVNNVNLTAIEKDKENNLTFGKEWVKYYLETYSEKTQKQDTEKKKQLMLTTLRQMRDEVKDCEKYYGKNDVLTQVAIAIKSFTHHAFNLGYYDTRDVMKVLGYLIQDLDVDTTEEEEFIKEIEISRREYL